jgi:hypothetical protein
MMHWNFIALLFSHFFLMAICKKKGKSANPELKYISCSICESGIEDIYERVAVLRKTAPYGKLDEIKVDEALDNICETSKKEGEWIRRVRIIEKEKKGKRYMSLEAPGGSSSLNVA